MVAECKVAVDAAVDTETGKQTWRDKHGSKFTAALLVFTLCLTAAALLVFKSHRKSPGQGEDNFDLHLKLRQMPNVRAAIHLQGAYNTSLKTSIEWRPEVEHSHSQGGLELTNNEIVIPQKGLYFVYSQASFRVSCSALHEDGSLVHLSHMVKRWSHSYGRERTNDAYRPILHSVRTVCQTTASSNPEEEGSWFTAVYIGAVFNLMRGDHLQTVMQEDMLEKLDDEPGNTFFGVFAL